MQVADCSKQLVQHIRKRVGWNWVLCVVSRRRDCCPIEVWNVSWLYFTSLHFIVHRWSFSVSGFGFDLDLIYRTGLNISLYGGILLENLDYIHPGRRVGGARWWWWWWWQRWCRRHKTHPQRVRQSSLKWIYVTLTSPLHATSSDTRRGRDFVHLSRTL